MCFLLLTYSCSILSNRDQVELFDISNVRSVTSPSIIEIQISYSTVRAISICISYSLAILIWEKLGESTFLNYKFPISRFFSLVPNWQNN